MTDVRSCNDILERYASTKYQIVIFLLLAFTAFKFTYDLSTLSLVTQPEQFWCSGTPSENHSMREHCFYHHDDNATQSLQPCTSWTYNRTHFKSSLVTEFNLVCNRANITNWILCLQFYGHVLGHTMGFLGDVIGRKKYILYCCLWESVITLLMGILPGLVPYMVLRLMHGFSLFIYIQAFTLLSELLPSSRRHIFMSAYFLLYSLGFITGGVMCYILRDRRQVILYGLLFNASYLFYFKVIPESPHWLILKRRYKEAHESLEFIARISGRELPDFKLREEEKSLIVDVEGDEDIKTTGNIQDLFKTPISRRKHLVLCYAKCALTLTDFSLMMNPTFFSPNIFLGAILQGIFEIPSGIISSCINSCLKRRLSLLLTFFISIVLIIAVPFSKQSDWLYSYSVPMIIAVFAKMILRTAIATNNTIAVEVFPTMTRSVGMTLWNGVSILTGSVSVWVNELEHFYYWLPQTIYCLSILVAMLAVYYVIPETSNHPLPNTVEEADNITLVTNKK